MDQRHIGGQGNPELISVVPLSDEIGADTQGVDLVAPLSDVANMRLQIHC